MNYYAMIDGEQKGPYDLNQLVEAGLRPSTYIWHKGLQDWIKAEEDPDICRFYRNRLYDIMHPQPVSTAADGFKVLPDQNEKTVNGSRTRFDMYLKETGEQLPTLEEIDARQNTDIRPVSMVGYAWLVTIVCFLPTGLVALVYAYKSRKAWNHGHSTEAHDYCRMSKMWTGISFFIGLMFYALIFAIF